MNHVALFLACFLLMAGIAAVAYAAITGRASDTGRRT
jgi:hypothetical protein